MNKCPERTFGNSPTIYRKCPLIERTCGHGPWVRADRCDGCDHQTAPERLDASFVVAATKALADPRLRGEKSDSEITRVLADYAPAPSVVEDAIVLAVGAGGLTATRAEELAREAGLDPEAESDDDPETTTG